MGVDAQLELSTEDPQIHPFSNSPMLLKSAYLDFCSSGKSSPGVYPPPTAKSKLSIGDLCWVLGPQVTLKTIAWTQDEGFAGPCDAQE